MPDIRPFRGILYNPHKIGNIVRVVTEPYDVISPSQQKAYYRMQPNNIIRLILGRRKPGDNSKNNRYTRARQVFREWLKKDILRRDNKESIYIYSQSFIHNKKRKSRTGFIVLLKLEDFSKNTILPHENTFSYPVQDRLKLLKTVRANLSPIFATFVDLQGKINKLLNQYKKARRPYIVLEKEGVVHKLWRMSEKRKIAKIRKLLQGRQIFIADGHHRYEAALNYKYQMQKKGRFKSSAPFNYVMTYLVATDEPGLTILPTHRVVKIKNNFNPQKTVQNFRKFFDVDKFSSPDDLFCYMRKQRSCHIFGTYFEKNKFYGLKLKTASTTYKFIDKSNRPSGKDLDVDILHRFIIGYILKINNPSKTDIYYTRNAQEAINLVDQGKYQTSFFLKPATVTQMRRVARAGRKMPHKSTYFYPKLLTGLVINKFNSTK